MDLETTKLSIEWVAIERLFCSPSDPRRNDPAVPHVAASIRRFGFRQPIVAKPSGEVIAGNTRLKAAQSLALPEVPVAWFDGSDLDATAYAIADNRTHEFAEWDDQSLAALLETLRAEDPLEGVRFACRGQLTPQCRISSIMRPSARLRPAPRCGVHHALEDPRQKIASTCAHLGHSAWGSYTLIRNRRALLPRVRSRNVLVTGGSLPSTSDSGRSNLRP